MKNALMFSISVLVFAAALYIVTYAILALETYAR